jgi:hypothetical protein
MHFGTILLILYIDSYTILQLIWTKKNSLELES